VSDVSVTALSIGVFVQGFTDCTRLLCRLQTGMRGAFGKPLGTVARVNIGQVIMSVRTKAQNKEHVVEALRRAKFKFPGRQKVQFKSLLHFLRHRLLQSIKPTSFASGALLVCKGCRQ